MYKPTERLQQCRSCQVAAKSASAPALTEMAPTLQGRCDEMQAQVYERSRQPEKANA